MAGTQLAFSGCAEGGEVAPVRELFPEEQAQPRDEPSSQWAVPWGLAELPFWPEPAGRSPVPPGTPPMQHRGLQSQGKVQGEGCSVLLLGTGTIAVPSGGYLMANPAAGMNSP